MHKEIEAIKDRLGRKFYELPRSEYRKWLDKTVRSYLAEGGYRLEPTNRPGISVIRKVSS